MPFGIDLNGPLTYLGSSARVFSPGERHVTRQIDMEVLIIMREGVLRFCEDGTECEVKAGEFYVQKSRSLQTAPRVSDTPQYYYIHFTGEWLQGAQSLPRRGKADFGGLYPLLSRLERTQYNGAPKAEQQAAFLEVLLALKEGCEREVSIADLILDDLALNISNPPTLDELAKKYNFSKNYIIKLFKARVGLTPYEYIKKVRLGKAKRLLRVENSVAAAVAEECGYRDYSRFYRDFVAETGVTPSQFRKRLYK